ncbi:uncharacterized protein A4U43_C01F11880 [Asparagus officinalis]|uniref:Uncharacterized protein n=1 Tax=Asparagus officinalis TaxID=4686 RepID=A0A5P1FNN4_ASPOF|nr:uncharacterized protein A4U43_C01F11880 [Asparagus officinalis]
MTEELSMGSEIDDLDNGENTCLDDDGVGGEIIDETWVFDCSYGVVCVSLIAEEMMTSDGGAINDNYDGVGDGDLKMNEGEQNIGRGKEIVDNDIRAERTKCVMEKGHRMEDGYLMLVTLKVEGVSSMEV